MALSRQAAKVLRFMVSTNSIGLKDAIDLSDEMDENINLRLGSGLQSGGGWRTQTVPFAEITTAGTKSPSWEELDNSGFFQYVFEDIGNENNEQELFATFVIPRELAVDSPMNFNALPIYPFVNWAPNGIGPGAVRWRLDWTHANGHDRDSFDFNENETSFVTQEAGIIPYRSHTAVGSPVPPASVEPDGTLILRVRRNSSDALDTLNEGAIGFAAGIQYFSDRLWTPHRLPEFYL